ncbi:MAG: FAD-dependent oxidoreductase [Acetobacteraceae bacterium]|nr:FAD-dependent oxidoreductase [Acetobacteraceae bacterium]
MSAAEFDLAIIGAGTAGLTIAAVAARLGVKVALIERDQMGGDCLNYGCVPSKALLAAAHRAATCSNGAALGVRFGAPEIDWSAVQAHVRGAIARIAPNDSEERFRGLGAAVFRAEARFIDPVSLDLGGQRIAARRFVIAAGSRTMVPNIPGLHPLNPLTNTTIFSLQEKPEHLIILGGGPIGLEMAQAFSCLGCRVTVVEAARIAGKEDPELADALRAVLIQQGVTIRERTAVASAVPGPVLVLPKGERLIGSHILVAAGRQPNIEDLGLEAGGIQASPAGVATDRGLRSVTNKRVFAAGDIADPQGLGPRAFTHLAAYHAGIVIRRALFRLPARLDYRSLPRVTYTDPELAQIGPTEAEARAAGAAVSIARWPLAENDRAITEGGSPGMVKLVISRGRLLGAGVLAPHAGEMAGLFALAIQHHISLTTLAGMILPYPTLAEAAKRAAAEFSAPRLFAPRVKGVVQYLLRLP